MFWWVAGGIVLLDVITKQLAVARLSDGSVRLIGDWLQIGRASCRERV